MGMEKHFTGNWVCLLLPSSINEEMRRELDVGKIIGLGMSFVYFCFGVFVDFLLIMCQLPLYQFSSYSLGCESITLN